MLGTPQSNPAAFAWARLTLVQPPGGRMPNADIRFYGLLSIRECAFPVAAVVSESSHQNRMGATLMNSPLGERRPAVT